MVLEYRKAYKLGSRICFKWFEETCGNLRKFVTSFTVEVLETILDSLW